MPNWNMNKLTLTGSDEQLYAIRALLGTDECAIDYSVLVPEPSGDIQPLPGVVPEGVYDWYSWRSEHWGCKWNTNPASVEYIDAGPGASEYVWDSPWSPPTAWFTALAYRLHTDFPGVALRLAYCEPGMAFAGIIHAAAGEVWTEPTDGEDFQTFAVEEGFLPDEWFEDEEEEDATPEVPA